MLGSCGKKAIPLAILGADVTVVDISEENRKFALEVANNARIDLAYIVSDLLELDINEMRNSFDIKDDALELAGDYFDNALQVGEVAHQKYFSDTEQSEFPKCLLKYWTMGEIISSFAAAGFVIDKLVEGLRFDIHKNIPGEFTLVATKR